MNLTSNPSKPTDIRITAVRTGYANYAYRTPIKFGGVALDKATVLNVECDVVTRSGQTARGFGSMPLSNNWAFPSRVMSYDQTLQAMTTLAERCVRLAAGYTEFGHPVDLGIELEEQFLAAALKISHAMGLLQPIPKLATLVTGSPFDAALHDAFGKAHGRNCFHTYDREFMSSDLSAYLGAEYKGEWLNDYLLRDPKPRLPLYHLVGALDPLTQADIIKPVNDGLPETLPQWIHFNGLTHLKIKLNGNDLAWDLERVIRVDELTSETQHARGVGLWQYSLDFNEQCQHVDYLIEFLRKLRERTPQGFERIQYIEQPTARDLRANPHNRMQEAAKLKPVVIDESLTDLDSLLLAREMGYTGAALKACKGQSQSLLMAAAAQKLGMFLCVQDLTCPGASLIHSASLAAHVAQVAAIEANSRQYCPAANRGWEERFPGIFNVRDGSMDTSGLNGAGLGAVPASNFSYLALLAFLFLTISSIYAADILPGTQLLDWPEEDLSGRLMDGAHRFVERKIVEAARNREQYWKYDAKSPEAWNTSIAENRARLQEIIGASSPRPAPRMERFGDEDAPALVTESALYRVYQVRWPAVGSVEGEGLLVQPIGAIAGCVVAVPDADQTPEQLLGLAAGIPPELQWARRLAENRFEIVIPTLVTRRLLETTDPQIQTSHQTEREWIYRQAYHMGRHVIGFEVQKVLAAVDWMHQHRTTTGRIGVAGYAEGGLIAFYAAAIDSRIDAALVSGYFNTRENIWAEPIYRNVWSLLKKFGDAEIASLILPRQLVIEYAAVPKVVDNKGDWSTPAADSVRKEFERIPCPPGFPHPTLIIGPANTTAGPGSVEACQAFAQGMGVSGPLALSSDIPVDQRPKFDADSRRRRVVANMEQHVQQLVQSSDQVRDASFLFKLMPELNDWHWSTQKSLPVRDPAPFIKGAKAFRERFHTDAMGRFDEPPTPLHPRMRVFRESEKWTAYDVVLDVWPEAFAWGLLVLPKNIAPGERRPVVVCQHGRDGLPRKTIDPDEPGYNQCAAKLAEEGFITFAPHNLYRGEDRYRWLNRKANSVQATLFSFIIAQHETILRWLDSLPQVDGSRIGFYGLSYGGETAVRVPPIVEKYALSICSGDFNQWTRKVAATDQPFSFMRSIEWEMPYWNLGSTFDYAEMAYLMIPRPFMVERGHLDLVGRDPWVAYEYAKVRWLYAQLGLADRTAIEFFQGGHSMRAEGTFEFLRKHLNWPERK